MVPSISISRVEELLADDIGQLWSPATVTVTWPPVVGLRAPSMQVGVIARARADMILGELERAHLQAAHDVIGAALLSIERPLEMKSIEC